MTLLDMVMPLGLEPALAAALVLLSFVTAFVTAALGLGGGMMLLAGLAVVLPAAAVIPVHGCVQVGSNAGRAFVQRAFVQWRLVVWFGLGAVIGSLVGGQFVMAMPTEIFQVVIALFILYSMWGPQPKVTARGPLADVLAGALTAGLGMIIGATGPLVAGFLKKLPDRRELVGTHAVLMTASHLFKVTAFTLFGFAFADYLPLIAAMIVSGFAGTLLGSSVLTRLPEAIFRIGFRLVLSGVAVLLLVNALLG